MFPFVYFLIVIFYNLNNYNGQFKTVSIKLIVILMLSLSFISIKEYYIAQDDIATTKTNKQTAAGIINFKFFYLSLILNHLI